MQFLPDGTLAVKTGAGWSKAFPNLGYTPQPAPAWMQAFAHNVSEFYTVRGGRAFAVANRSGGIDVISAKGTTCGTLPFNVDSGAWAVGRDGTLSIVDRLGDHTPRWWPQLLK